MRGTEPFDIPALELVEGVPILRLGEIADFSRTVALVAGAIRRAATDRHRHLLVCAAEVSFSPPSLAARHQMVRRWAAAAEGRVRLAIVARPDFIDPERLGVVAAANFGLSGEVFSREDDALAWLRTATGRSPSGDLA